MRKSKRYLPYPIWAACLYERHILVSGGGGGQKFGIPNKLSLFKTGAKLENPITEKDTGEDLITYLDTHGGGVLAAQGKSVLLIQINKEIQITCGTKVENTLTLIRGKGNYICAGSDKGQVYLWQQSSADLQLHKSFDVCSEITGVDMNLSHWQIAVTAKDKTCKVLSMKTGELLKTLSFQDDQGPPLMIKGCFFKGNTLVTMQSLFKKPCYISFWDVNKDFHPIDSVFIHPTPGSIFKVSKSGKRGAIGTSDGSVKVIDLDSLSILYTSNEFDMPTTTIDVSPNDKMVFAGSADYAYVYKHVQKFNWIGMLVLGILIAIAVQFFS